MQAAAVRQSVAVHRSRFNSPLSSSSSSSGGLISRGELPFYNA